VKPLYKHITRNDGVRCTMAILPLRDRFTVGYAWCSPRDQFSRRKGREIALHRARHVAWKAPLDKFGHASVIRRRHGGNLLGAIVDREGAEGAHPENLFEDAIALYLGYELGNV